MYLCAKIEWYFTFKPEIAQRALEKETFYMSLMVCIAGVAESIWGERTPLGSFEYGDDKLST